MSPLAKIRKTDSRGMEKEPPAGIIRFEVDNVSRLCADRSSHEIEVKGVPWKASVCRTNLSTHSGTIDGSLFCTIDQSKDWKIDLDAEFILVHSDSTKNTTVEGFIKDDRITVEVHFWIRDMKGIKTTSPIDFSDPNEPFHNVALVIGEEKVYVSKEILAVHSPVFKAMFFGDFAEKNKKEFELKDVERECVIDRVEEFIIASDDFIIDEKLQMADEIKLFSLLRHCASKLESEQDFRNIKNSPIYNILSMETKAFLFEELLETLRKSRL